MVTTEQLRKKLEALREDKQRADAELQAIAQLIMRISGAISVTMELIEASEAPAETAGETPKDADGA